jgi:hypothetical protein
MIDFLVFCEILFGFIFGSYGVKMIAIKSEDRFFDTSIAIGSILIVISSYIFRHNAMDNYNYIGQHWTSTQGECSSEIVMKDCLCVAAEMAGGKTIEYSSQICSTDKNENALEFCYRYNYYGFNAEDFLVKNN